MPWNPQNAARHTRKAKTSSQKRKWSAVANSALERGASEGSAIRQANSVVAGTAHHGGGRMSGKRRSRMAGKGSCMGKGSYSMKMSGKGGKKAPVKSPMRKTFGKGVAK